MDELNKRINSYIYLCECVKKRHGDLPPSSFNTRSWCEILCKTCQGHIIIPKEVLDLDIGEQRVVESIFFVGDAKVLAFSDPSLDS